MSFILDALRRADAERERERGRVPGLNSQADALPPVATATAAARRPATTVLGWLLSGAGAGLVLAAALGWWWSASRPDPGLGPAGPAPGEAGSVDMAAAQPPIAATPPDAAGRAVAPGTTPLQAQVPVPPPTPMPTRAAPGPAELPEARAPAAQRPPAATGAQATQAEAAVAPAAVAATRTAKVPRALAQAASAPAPVRPADGALPPLSAADRQRLPKLQIGGAMYSEERSARMLVVNDQLLREGDRAAPGVTLLRIGPRSARFVFEGQGFDLPY